MGSATNTDSVRTKWGAITQVPLLTVWVWGHYALANLGAKDDDGYRQVCAQMVQRFGQAQNVGQLELLAWFLCLRDKAVEDSEMPMRFAEKAVAAGRTASTVRTLAMTKYRAGKFDEAQKLGAETLKLRGKTDDLLACLFLSMTHVRQGRAEEGQRWFDKAVRSIEADKREDEANPPQKRTTWHNRGVIETLTAEAQGLLKK